MMSLPSVSNSEQKFPFTQTNFAAVGQPVPSRGSAPRRPHRGLPDRGGGGGSRARSPPSGGGRAEAGPGRDGGTGRGRPARSGEPMAAVGAGGAARGRAGRERDCAGLRGCESGPGPAERCRIGSGREPEPGGGQRAGTMSQESLQGMDEGALRKLLEATLDLAERRRIRSAIRELQRQELERDEEALASKRFRTERGSHRQDNKENWLRSQQLEEEQQKALASLSRELESITDVEELTKLLRAASEYEERKLIRAAIRKLRAEEIEAATLAGNVQSSRRDGAEPAAVPARAERSRRDDAETAALVGNGESSQRAGSELPAVVSVESSAEPVENSRRGDAEQAVLSRTEESSHGGDADRLPAEEPERSVAHEQEEEQEHRQAELQDLSNQQLREPQKPPAQASGTLVLLDLHPALEPTAAPQPDERTAEVELRTERASECELQYREEGSGSPCSAREPVVEPAEALCSTGQSRQAEQHGPTQPCAGTQSGQFVICVRGQVSGKAVMPQEKPAAPTQSAARTPSRLNAQRWEQTPSSPCPQGRAEPSPVQRSSSVRERAQRFTPSGATPVGTAGRQRAAAGGPEGAGGAAGRAGPGQWQRGPRTAPPGPAQNARGAGGGGAEQRPPPAGPRPAGTGPTAAHDGMKTYFTIEIKDGRVQPHTQSVTPRIVAAPGSQRAELTLGLRSTPIRITAIPSSTGGICSISTSSNVVKPMEPELVVEQPQAPRLQPELPNGMEKVQVREVEKKSKLNVEELNRIEDEDVLDKMLDQTTDFEERRLIRNAMRELRQRKRDQREKERDQRLQEMKSQATVSRAGHNTETTTTQSTQSADGSARSTVTKTERLIQSNDGSKTSRTTTMESSYVKRSDNGSSSTFVQTKSSYSSSSKKTGSIFDREDESASRQSSLAALERRQAEKKKELMKAQSLPKTSTSQARKAMIEKLQKEGGSSPNPAAPRAAVQRSSSCGVPNANSIKQMLLDWCRAKTRGYEHVDIQNFSSSWSDGMAFCALVHNFFPDAFDYSQLTPQNRRHNFEVAFSSAEKHADCPQLLDVEDMVRMREPDWKCVYTYIQEFYRCLVQKGLVKTKKS
ncbi:smoothelin isoform X5 [Gallus gallus]|uniref:smoothelin isoform X5 n=1 Tax=Gallus gallus TaxID=9031 RepID=UPI001F0266AB|nr:smoothelin isoform X5 [Gallus gallus]